MNPNRKPIVVVASLGAVLAGTTLGIYAMNTSANAATTATSVVSQTNGSTDATAASSAKVAETPLTGDDLAKATAAANTASPGAMIERAKTDADGDSFEVYITKADGPAQRSN